MCMNKFNPFKLTAQSEADEFENIYAKIRKATEELTHTDHVLIFPPYLLKSFDAKIYVYG